MLVKMLLLAGGLKHIFPPPVEEDVTPSTRHLMTMAIALVGGAAGGTVALGCAILYCGHKQISDVKRRVKIFAAAAVVGYMVGSFGSLLFAQ